MVLYEVLVYKKRLRCEVVRYDARRRSGAKRKKYVGYNIVSNVMNSVFYLFFFFISPAIFVSDSLSVCVSVCSLSFSKSRRRRDVLMLNLILILLVGFFFAQGQVVRQRVDDELLHVLRQGRTLVRDVNDIERFIANGIHFGAHDVQA